MLHSRGFAAALFDRDGTLIEDVPYNGEPALVRPVPGTREALDRLRSVGLRLGVVGNQSGVARGLLTPDQVRRVNARVEELLGPFDTWQYCPHGPDQGCACRKPAPGMILDAARALGVPARRCVMVGDIGADVAAGLAAGAAVVLVPTRADEVATAPVVASDLAAAADWILAADPRKARPRVLVARGDSTGDMLPTGPARSVVAEASRVTLLCGPRGRDAARLLWHVHGPWTTAFVQGGHEYLVPVTPDRGPYGRPGEWDLAERWLRRELGRDVPRGAGVLSTDVDELVAAARWLGSDDAAGRRFGAPARNAAQTRYGLPRFLSDWDAILKDAILKGVAS